MQVFKQNNTNNKSNANLKERQKSIILENELKTDRIYFKMLFLMSFLKLQKVQ